MAVEGEDEVLSKCSLQVPSLAQLKSEDGNVVLLIGHLSEFSDFGIKRFDGFLDWLSRKAFNGVHNALGAKLFAFWIGGFDDTIGECIEAVSYLQVDCFGA